MRCGTTGWARVAVIGALLVAALRGPVATGAPPATVTVGELFGERVEFHPYPEDACPLCVQLRAFGAVRQDEYGRRVYSPNQRVDLARLSTPALRSLEELIRKARSREEEALLRGEGRPNLSKERQRNALEALRTYREKREQEERQRDWLRRKREVAEEQERRQRDEQDRSRYQHLREAVNGQGVEYVVFADPGSPARLAGGNTLVVPQQGAEPAGSEGVELLRAFQQCPEHLRGELRSLAATWGQVSVPRLRHATAILTAPLLEARADRGKVRLFHAGRQELGPLEPRAVRNHQRIPAEWRQVGSLWLIDVRKLTEDPRQVREVCQFARELEDLAGVRTHVVLGEEGWRHRLACLPEPGSILIVYDRSIARVAQDGPLFLRHLETLKRRNIPGGNFLFLFGHVQEAGGPLTEWIGADPAAFHGKHVIVGACNHLRPDLMHQLALVALRKGARGVVISTDEIDVPAYTFAADAFARLPSFNPSWTAEDIWAGCYADALRRLEHCLAQPGPAAALRSEFPGLWEHLVPNGQLNQRRVDQLKKALASQAKRFKQLGDARRGRAAEAPRS